jgi:hypothetical protein
MRRRFLWVILVGGLACAFSGKALAQGGAELTPQDAKDTVRTTSYCKKITYQMTAGKIYQIDMKSTQIDPYLRLEDPTGQQVAFDDDSGGFPNARITYSPKESGLFTIVCTTFGGGSTGAYTLDVKETAGSGLTVKIALNPDKAQVGANYTATATVHSQKTGVLHAELTVPQGDRVISSPPDQSITAGGATTFSWIVTCGAAGKVSVLVTLVNATQGPAKDFSGELTANDPKDSVRTNSFANNFTYKLEKDRTYQIDMKSKDFDSYLRLENPAGAQVAIDDDSGGYPDARIIHKAQESGVFKIVATSFAGGAGKFTVTVRDTASGPVAPLEANQLKFTDGKATFKGSEDLAGFGSLTFVLGQDGKATMIDARTTGNGSWTQVGRTVTITFSNCVYAGQVDGEVLQGTAHYTEGAPATWSFRVQKK